MMFSEYKYKTEIHLHTKPASSCGKVLPEDVIKAYKKSGYDSITVTNHFYIPDNCTKEEWIEKILADYHKMQELGKNAGINIILGLELRFTEHINDYLIYGIEEEELWQIYDLLDKGIDNFYKTYKNDKNVIFQAHPFRDNMRLADVNSIDGIEVFNLHPGHNSRIGFAAKYARENNLLITAGTDFHEPGRDSLCGIMTKEPITSSIQLAKILKERDFIIDISGFKVLPI